MSSQAFELAFLICSLIFFRNGVIAGRWNISIEEDLELEKHLKMLNKPAIKTILTDHGDIYDCVEFYKQPAFDHPLLKDYKVDIPVKALTRPQKQINNVSQYESDIEFGLKDGECPFGTVPIRRITKEDLIREKFAKGIRPLRDDNVPGAYYAILRTSHVSTRYTGAACAGSVWQPKVTDQQYSGGRMKISNGDESLEVGWRVDPTLYGNKKSRLYIRTDAGQSHCYDTRCSGYIIVDPRVPPGISLEISRRGGPIKQLPLSLGLDSAGNWNLDVLAERRKIGFWPKRLFTRLGNWADSVEWGGEVFGPPGTPKPAMGSGYRVSGNQTLYDAYFARLSVGIGGTMEDARNLERFMNNENNYNVINEEDTGTSFYRRLLFYGGSATPNS